MSHVIRECDVLLLLRLLLLLLMMLLGTIAAAECGVLT
jgi:hypothetical protein